MDVFPYPPWPWLPITIEAVASPLAVDAGADFDADYNIAHALAGSVSGGTPPYATLWSVVSAPVGGLVSFVDATDPTTSATFTGASGDFVLRLTATDADGSVAGDRVRVTVGPAFLLNALNVQPLWAHSIGVQLHSAQTKAFRVRRSSDDAEVDVGFVGFTGTIAQQLVAHCGAFAGFVVKVYNAVPASPYPELSAPSSAEQVKCYDVAPFFGATGFVCVDVVPDGATAFGYSRADSLGLAGDVALVTYADHNPSTYPVDYNHSLFAIGNNETYPAPAPAFSRFCLTAWADDPDDVFVAGQYGGGGVGGLEFSQAYSATIFTGGGAGGYQVQRAVGTVLDNRPCALNGVTSTLALFGTTDGVLNFGAGAQSTSWLNFGMPGFYVDGTPPYGKHGSAVLWHAASLSAADQATLDAWSAAHHS